MPGNAITATATCAAIPPDDLLIYFDAQSEVKGTRGKAWKTGGYEGENHYLWQYTISDWWAGFGLNLDNRGNSPPLDVTGYESLRRERAHGYGAFIPHPSG